MKIKMLLVCILFTVSQLYTSPSIGESSDSIKTKSGRWIQSMIQSFDNRALYLDNDTVVMFKVVSEIRISDEVLAAKLSHIFDSTVIEKVDGRWIINFENSSIPKVVKQESKILSNKKLLLTITTTRVKNFEIQLHFDEAFSSWSVFQIALSGGVFASNETVPIVGASKIFYSTIDYQAFQFTAGIGVENDFAGGKMGLIASAGNELMSGSYTTVIGTSQSLFEDNDFVYFFTLQYIRPVTEGPINFALYTRYYISSSVVDSKVDRFAFGVGLGFPL